MTRILQGDGTWPFTVEVDGEDLVCRGVNASWFGGANDSMDDGSTASGISTKAHPDLLGCALPMQIGARGGDSVTFAPTHGSPFPQMPFRSTKVRVWCGETNKVIIVELIDIGPAKWACEQGNVIDLTQAAFRALGVSTARGVVKVDFRVLGGAQYIQ